MGSNLTKRISALSCNSRSNELGGSPSQSKRSRAQALTTRPYHHISVSQRRHQTMCTHCWPSGVHFSARADGHGSRALQQGLAAGSRGKLASAREPSKLCEWYLSGRSSYWERCWEHWERVLVGWSPQRRVRMVRSGALERPLLLAAWGLCPERRL